MTISKGLPQGVLLIPELIALKNVCLGPSLFKAGIYSSASLVLFLSFISLFFSLISLFFLLVLSLDFLIVPFPATYVNTT